MKYPFFKLDGIELVPEISQIAIRNFRMLKTKRVKIFNINCIEFDKYSDYNYFYLFSPFPCNIFNKLLDKILEQTKK